MDKWLFFFCQPFHSKYIEDDETLLTCTSRICHGIVFILLFVQWQMHKTFSCGCFKLYRFIYLILIEKMKNQNIFYSKINFHAKDWIITQNKCRLDNNTHTNSSLANVYSKIHDLHFSEIMSIEIHTIKRTICY